MALGPSEKKGASFSGFLLLSASQQPPHLFPIPSLLEVREGSAASPATATTPDATTTTIAITTAITTASLPPS